jgi:adenylate cyclase
MGDYAKAESQVPEADIRPLNNKVLFVAYVAVGQGDVGPTVFGRHEPLIYLHSTALNGLIQSRWVKRSGRLVDALWLCSALLVVTGARWCRTKWALFVWWATGVFVIAAVGAAALFWMNIVLPTVATASLWTLATVVEIARRNTNELVERQRLRNTMGLYFSPRVLKRVLENPGRLEPKRVEITVLLTDQRNSTALAERLGTKGMLNLLNRIFTVENAAVFAEDGSIEKPVGDQFLAYWGAPDPQTDAADRALRAAMKLIEGLHDLEETFDSQVKELFGYGLALHAGESLIANIGSAQFFHYGLVGDLINATARVESLTKHYGVLAFGTLEFFKRLSHPPEARMIDRVMVKGKSAPIELLELRHRFSPANFHEIATNYAEAFVLYEEAKFEHAERIFRKQAEFDKPSRVLAARCAELCIHPPENWRAIFALETR